MSPASAFQWKNLPFFPPFWINLYSSSPRLAGIKQEIKREKRIDWGGGGIVPFNFLFKQLFR